MSAITNHLLSHLVLSSAVLLLALAASFAPRLTARTKFWIMAAGIAKFALPAAIALPLIDALMPVRPALFVLVAPQAAAQTAAQQAATLDPTQAIAALWIAIAIVLIVRTIVLGHSTARAMLRSATAATPREQAALADAKQRTGITHTIALVRSEAAAAPAVLRFFRPVMVLPAHGIGSLDDDELVSLLSHECAHVARRDNLLGVAEAAIRATFWFNPLLWIAARRLAALREESCDERAADSVGRAEIYAAALAKFSCSIVDRPVMGVAGMASRNLKGRIDSIMRYSTLRETALPHRLIAGVTLAVLIISTGTAAALTATAVPSSGPYLITPKVVRDNNTFVLDAKVVDTRNSAVVAQPSVRVNAGSSASVSAQSGTTRVTIDFAIAQNGEGTALLRVAEDGLVVQETTHRLSAAQPARSAQYQGEPISIHFENADVRDVLARFGRVSGIEMVIDANVAGTVTRKIDNVPWDQALDEIIAANGLTYAVDGKKLRISKK